MHLRHIYIHIYTCTRSINHPYTHIQLYCIWHREGEYVLNPLIIQSDSKSVAGVFNGCMRCDFWCTLFNIWSLWIHLLSGAAKKNSNTQSAPFKRMHAFHFPGTIRGQYQCRQGPNTYGFPWQLGVTDSSRPVSLRKQAARCTEQHCKPLHFHTYFHTHTYTHIQCTQV